MTPICIITGFLGSGKTTLIRHLLLNRQGARIAVIQNEFAAIGIDGEELRSIGGDFHITEINNGSVFCVCRMSDFTRSIATILSEYKPDLICLEASEMSDPLNLMEVLQKDDISSLVELQNTICVVDASNIERSIKIMQRTVHQIRIADTVILNKIDTEGVDVEKIKQIVLAENPFAEIIATVNCDVNIDKIFGTRAASREIDTSHLTDKQDIEAIKIASLRTSECISESGLNRFLDTIEPDTIRIKGYVNLVGGRTVALQSSFGQRKVTDKQQHNAPTEIVVFGNRYNASELRQVFKQCL